MQLFHFALGRAVKIRFYYTPLSWKFSTCMLRTCTAQPTDSSLFNYRGLTTSQGYCIMDLQLLTRPDAENQVKACLSSLKPVERAEALIAMGNMLSELNQKNIQECGQAATVLLAAIESYKPWLWQNIIMIPLGTARAQR
ncbi:hypothetical protein BDZ91DRAFT_36237 [Kalaharituber pfeilii]|nr:hypothetical protein BDZ91DRAFT_36237 [Kalaharituber pfeilii]